MAFNVISNITLDMQHPYSTSDIVRVNQYDTAGVIKAQLMNDGTKWSVPQGAKPVVMFKKTDNIGGFYDVTELDPNTAAVSVDSDRSIIYISLDPQTTTTATGSGKYVNMQVAFYENGLRLSTFAFYMQVSASVVTSGEVTSSWVFNILSKEIADTLTVATTPQAMTDWLDENIVGQTTGYVIDKDLVVEDAAADAKAAGRMVVVSDSNPNLKANKVWVKKTPSTVQIPTVEELDEVKDSLNDLLDNRIIDNWSAINQYIPLNNTTTDVNNPVTPSSSSNVRYIVEPCGYGDIYIVTSSGGSASRAYGFISSDGNVLQKANANVTITDRELIAPENTSYLVVNDTSLSGKVIRKGTTVIEKFTNISNENVATRSMLNTEWTELSWRKAGEYGIKWDEPGNTISSSVFAYTDYVLILGFDRLRYMRVCSTGGMSCGLAYYDKDYKWVYGVQGLANQPTNNPVVSETVVPEEAVYVRFTYRKDTETYGEFSVSGRSKIINKFSNDIEIVDNELGDINDEIENIETTINDINTAVNYTTDNENLIQFLGKNREMNGGGEGAAAIAFSKIGDMFYLDGICPDDSTGYYWFGLLSKPQPTRTYNTAQSSGFRNWNKEIQLQENHIYEISFQLISGEAIGDDISLRMFDTNYNQCIDGGCYIGNTKIIYLSNSANVNLVLRIGPNSGFSNAKIFVSLKDITDTDRIIPLIYSDVTIKTGKLLALERSLENNQNYNTFEFYPVDNNYTYYVNQRCFVSQFSDASYSAEIKRDCYKPGSIVRLDSATRFVVISVYVTTTDTFCFHALKSTDDEILGVQTDRIDHASMSYGVMNSIAAADQFLNIKYTPVGRLPYCPGIGKKSFIPAGTTCRGIPYSSTGVLSKCVGQHLSFYTFLSAMNNPRSVLYTRRIAFRPTGSTYYGGTCFNYTSYAFGSRLGYYDNTYSHIDIDKDYTLVSPYEMQEGDLIMATNHVAMIIRVFRDAYGRIQNYIAGQSRPPFPTKLTYKFEVLSNGYLKFDSYDNMRVFRPNKRIDRRTGRNDYGTYTPLPFVKGYPDETMEETTYPDIMSEYGDKACVEAGIDVIINVINPSGYNKIEVYKNNVLIETKNAVGDFTMTDITYGTYTFKLVGNSKSSESKLIVADIHADYDPVSKIVTFSSANATPMYAAAYADSDSYAEKHGVMHYVKRFTTSESNSGSANVSDIVNSRFPHVLVGFFTEYGVAVWLSRPFDDAWEPIDENTSDVDIDTDDQPD